MSEIAAACGLYYGHNKAKKGICLSIVSALNRKGRYAQRPIHIGRRTLCAKSR